MAVQVSYPGVYIQEVPSGVRTITGVSTSIGAFLGRASKGPIDKAVRLLSYADYERSFGAPHPSSDLAQSVRMFFDNGGTDCYVVRLAPGAAASTVTIHTLDDTSVLVATAKAAGVWGNTIRLEVDYNTANPYDTFNLRVIFEEGGEPLQTESFSALSMNPTSPRFAPSFVSQSSALIDLMLDASWGDPTNSDSDYNDLSKSFAGFSNGRRPLRDPSEDPALTADSHIQAALNSFLDAGQSKFDISVNDGPYVTVDLSIAPHFDYQSPPDFLGDIATNIATKINDALASLSPAPRVTVSISDPILNFGRMLTITAGDPTVPADAPWSSVRIRRAATNDIAAALMLGVDQGGIEAPRWSNLRPAPTASILNIGLAAPVSAGDLRTVDALMTVPQQDIDGIFINSTKVMVNGSTDYDLKTTIGTDLWYQNANGDSTVTGDNDGVREKLRIIANAINDGADLGFRAEVWGYHLAVIATDGAINNEPSTVKADPATGAFDNGIVTNVRQYSLGQVVGTFSSGDIPGDDGGLPDQKAYLGSEIDQTGFHALDSVDLFNLMVLPGDAEVGESAMVQDVWGPASNYCHSRRAFLLVDPPQSWTNSTTGRPAVVQDTAKITDLRGTMVKHHAAVFYPRLRYSDNGLIKTIGPAGAMAGLMARTDANRGVWKAPAGIEAGVRGITGVNLELTDAENGVLNKKGVNCLRALPNGIVNWGARTLDGDDDFGSEWKYIPIRRFALFLEESLYRGTRWVVFEPNDEPLWANIRLNINAFMFSLFRQQAFQGTSPQEGYYVRCDKTTTTQDDRNKGIVNIEVGFAPLKPAEFVVIKIQQMAGEL